MAKRKSDKEQITIYKALHRKLMIVQHQPHLNEYEKKENKWIDSAFCNSFYSKENKCFQHYFFPFPNMGIYLVLEK